MKTFLRTIAILSVVACFASCSENAVECADETLDVTPHNISGYWVLTKFNGMDIPEGTYCYIEYIRKDRKFVMYQKFDSMYPRMITGVYSIENDKKKGYILSGIYDFGMGEWNNRYIVVELLADSMILKADAENSDICCYERCGGIPSDILEQAK